ncbi:MAG: IS66 family insertion sequence element accessory protein TnpB [Clostridia bacterium]|nr:IS66 family insertion sequence element accessory protein TnpB [Clostridia bacterium]
MLGDTSGAEKIYIACGYTDMRKAIDGLAALVEQNFKLSPYENSLFLFCGRRRDRIKALYWEGDGFLLLYKTIGTELFVLNIYDREYDIIIIHTMLVEAVTLLTKEQMYVSCKES